MRFAISRPLSASFGESSVEARRLAQFRGPAGAGVSSDTHLPTEISADKALWKTAIPPGHSSADSRWLPHLPHRRRRRVARHICLDRGTGKVLWRRDAPRPRKEGFQKTNSPASPLRRATGNQSSSSSAIRKCSRMASTATRAGTSRSGPSTTRTVTGPRDRRGRLGGSDLRPGHGLVSDRGR